MSPPALKSAKGDTQHVPLSLSFFLGQSHFQEQHGELPSGENEMAPVVSREEGALAH